MTDRQLTRAEADRFKLEGHLCHMSSIPGKTLCGIEPNLITGVRPKFIYSAEWVEVNCPECLRIKKKRTPPV